mmetsp:Transcript_15852/g.24467  ORF Transcript_15852/g.24467 Transcript_15852/m.24467 type:complete len:225 (+) Transcript_15852:101-775(+)
MALTGDVYANEDSSSEEEAAVMENNPSAEAEILAAAADDDNDGNIKENIKFTASRLKKHDEQMESDSTSQQNTEEKDAAVSSAGAGLLFGLSGLILGGPVLGTIAGVSAAVVASNDQGPAGDNARAAGTFAITTGSKVGDAARDVNEKHGILDWIQNVLSSGWGKVRQFDDEHHTSETVKETMSTVSDKVVGFEREHHLFENMLEGIQSGVQFLLEKVKGANKN